MSNTKKKKVIMGVIIGAALAFVTLITLIGVIGYLFLFGGPATVSRDTADYKKIFSENGLHTGYICFPEEIPEGTMKTDFYHYYRDTWNYATVETFLQCDYSPEAYQKELNRLQNTMKTYGNRKAVLRRDDAQRYAFPAYIAEENSGYTYEYALLSGKDQITYVMTTDFRRNDVHFDKKYLPQDYMEGEEYSIYFVSSSESGTINDYSRDPAPEINDFHFVITDEKMSMVTVYFKLDSDGNEVITKVDYTTDPDVKTGEVKISEYHDLDGKVYKDIKADYDKHNAIITYLDEGEEKTAVYP